MTNIMNKFLFIFLIILFFSFPNYATTEDTTSEVICNIIKYIWQIGGPLMTVVIIGAALLAIFGRMPWPALVALGVFCAVFFGAKTIVEKLVPENSKPFLEKCAVK
ncbi:MAG: TrbC/VirB2 family protein [Wolbachia endosymbiont of Fragariocoptes setiger]|nr:TrbC/VirB2 family protein [Wolbachia endosymbiont of Fragariocoptes setiger]